MTIFTSAHAVPEQPTVVIRRNLTVEFTPLLRLVDVERCPVSWCQEHYGPSAAFPTDRSSHHFAEPRDVRVGDRVVRMRVDQFDADAAGGVIGEPVVSISVDGVEGFDLSPADALRFAALLIAQAGIARASRVQAVAS